MTEECKKWVLELADSALSIGTRCKPGYEINTIAILIKAMWAINREKKWRMDINSNYVGVYTNLSFNHFEKMDLNQEFRFRDFFNSEQKALQSALQHIFDNKDK